MLQDIANTNAIGFLKIEDNYTGEVLVDKGNAIHFGNMASSIANSLVGNKDAFISYIAFGNNGTIISGTQITYKPPRVSTVENTYSSLYETTYIRKLTNGSSVTTDPNNIAEVPANQSSSTYTDLVITTLLETGDNGPTGQDPIDNATDSSGAFVFDEIAIYSGTTSTLVFPWDDTSNINEINGFISDSTTKMLTHVIFHPVQKSQNRSLKITYTIRIQMSEG